MAEHSIFAPSSLHRILACPASFQESQKVAKEKSSVYARKGTLKHDAFTKVWPHYVAGMTNLYEEVWKFCKIMTEQDAEMQAQMPWKTEDEQHVLSACDFVKAQLITCGPNATITLESRVSLASWGLPDIWGTPDIVIHDPDNRRILLDDEKYGQGVPVYAEDNPQLMSYMAGVVGFPPMYDTYSISIVQPPLDLYSTFEFDTDQLKAFVATLKEGIELCKSDNPVYNPSTETCKFCPARNNCRARYDLAMTEAQQVFGLAGKLPDVTPEMKAKLASMLANLEQVKKSVYADLQATIMNGGSVPGYKLVAGRSIRKWADDGAALKFLMKHKHLKEDDLFEEKFISPSKAEKLNRLLKKNEDFKKLITKPVGKPQLVPESDKRPDYDINATADSVFEKVK